MLQARHITAGLGVGLAASYLVWLHRRRTRPRLAAEATGGDAAAAAEEEVCAICLSTPELPCKTQCGHRFCTDCFVAWWQRQPGVLGGPHVGEARCPLCTRSVARLSPEFGATVSGGLSRLRAIVLYNVGATITRRLRLARRWLDAVRLVGERTTLSVYAVTGVVWEVARNELHSSLVQVPPPADERVRFFCAWQMLATAFGHHLDLPLLQWAASALGARVVSAICRALSDDYVGMSHGAPDLLFLSSSPVLAARLVEVKGPNDKLSDGQHAWIDVLVRAGADVEVAYVERC